MLLNCQWENQRNLVSLYDTNPLLLNDPNLINKILKLMSHQL